MPFMDDCAELQNALLATHTIEDFLEELPRIAARHVAEGVSCGVTIRPEGGRRVTVTATDPVAAGADEVQYRLADGPSMQALRDGELVTIDDTAWRQRWPEFEARAAAAGIRSCLAVPMQAPPADPAGPWGRGEHSGPGEHGEPGGPGERRGPAPKRAIGVLSLYARDRDAFGAEQARRAERFAENAALTLAIAERLASYANLSDQLRASLDSRPVIDQALGIIIAREKCTQPAAFEILRKVSQNSNTKLRDLAERIVTGATGEPLQRSPFALPGGPLQRPPFALPGEPSAAPTVG
jgi:GAF domain-containing protein